MGLRDWANQHPRVVAAIACGCVLICAGGIAAEVIGSRQTISRTLPSHYFTVDDGKTFFVAAGKNVAPFSYQGAIAVRAYVFECGGHRFVGFLERYKPEAQKAEIAGTISPELEVNGRELKKPGDAKWTSSSDHPALGRIMDVPCPDGSGGIPNPVEP